MDAQFIARIKKELSLRETEDLQAIWNERDTDQWTAETFEAVRQILLERGEMLAERKVSMQRSGPKPRRKQWVRKAALEPEPELDNVAWPEPIAPAEEFFPFAENELLPGFPGYRTRPNRSGYDYIDTQLEVAHMAGEFLRDLFWNRLSVFSRGVNPLIGLLLGVVLCVSIAGVLPMAIPLYLIILAIMAGKWYWTLQFGKKK